jgi:hypothetical protein
MSGAVNKLFFDHAIAAVCPAEDLLVNKRAQEVMKKANALPANASPAQVAKMLSEQERVILHERDAAVQQLIRNAPTRYRGAIVIAVFGDAHDWTDATIAANKRPGAKKYSYIKITPKTGTTW